MKLVVMIILCKLFTVAFLYDTCVCGSEMHMRRCASLLDMDVKTLSQFAWTLIPRSYKQASHRHCQVDERDGEGNIGHSIHHAVRKLLPNHGKYIL